MPTWRKLHVKATESLDINDMPDDFHRLLWVMLPLGLDREGRGLDLDEVTVHMIFGVGSMTQYEDPQPHAADVLKAIHIASASRHGGTNSE